MNMNRLINMGVRMAMRHGSKYLANRGKSQADMTPDERKSAQSSQVNMRRAQQGLRFFRRFMR